MIPCATARDELALNPTTEDPAVRAHAAQCSACAGYQARHAALDGALRSELRWEAPADLTMRLLALAAAAPALAAAGRPRPKGWHITLAYLAAVIAVGLSLAVGWQLIALLAGQLGLQAAIAQALAAPSQWLAQLAKELPESRYAIDFFLKVRAQLMWLLLAAVLWAVLDKWNPSFSFRRQQQIQS